MRLYWFLILIGLINWILSVIMMWYTLTHGMYIGTLIFFLTMILGAVLIWLGFTSHVTSRSA